MQYMEYCKIWLNLTFAPLSLTFIGGHKAFVVFRADRVINGSHCGQGQLSRIWKVQCDWLTMGKECCSWLSRRLWGRTKHKLPLKSPAWEATFGVDKQMDGCTVTLLPKFLGWTYKQIFLAMGLCIWGHAWSSSINQYLRKFQLTIKL